VRSKADCSSEQKAKKAMKKRIKNKNTISDKKYCRSGQRTNSAAFILFEQ